MDARLAWRPAGGLEVSLVGRNLLSSAPAGVPRPEFIRAVPSGVGREVYARISWRY